MRAFYVYILGSRSGVLYIGITSDLERRIYEHRYGVVEGFTKKYGVKRLLYCEEFNDPVSAISREKQTLEQEQETGAYQVFDPDVQGPEQGVEK
jgi:predicted GIY-YIG superfamily endonuclease